MEGKSYNTTQGLQQIGKGIWRSDSMQGGEKPIKKKWLSMSSERWADFASMKQEQNDTLNIKRTKIALKMIRE